MGVIVVFPVVVNRCVVVPRLVAGPADVVPANPTTDPTVTVRAVFTGSVVGFTDVGTTAVNRYIH